MPNKLVLITGGSRGLGRNAAIHLARAGHDVIITYRGAEAEAHQAIDEIRKLGRKGAALQLDVSQSKTFAAFANQVRQILKDQWGRANFDALVNNAGMGIYASIAETAEEQFDQLSNVHFKGTFFLTQKLLPLIADGGSIINLSSGLARFSIQGYAAYAAMKGGIEVLTRYLALELGPRRIRVNSLAPGAIETDFGGGLVRDNKQLNQMIAGQTPLGRVGLPDDIGGAIAALISDDSRWINAQRIEASGGIHM